MGFELQAARPVGHSPSSPSAQRYFAPAAQTWHVSRLAVLSSCDNKDTLQLAASSVQDFRLKTAGQAENQAFRARVSVVAAHQGRQNS